MCANTCVDKSLLAMQCLNSAIALAPTDPKVHERTVQFRHVVAPQLSSLPESTAEVLKSEFPALTSSETVQAFNDKFLEENKGSPRHVHSGIRARKMLGGDQDACEAELVKLIGAEGMQLGDAAGVLGTLAEWGSGKVGEVKEAGRKRWAEASVFA